MSTPASIVVVTLSKSIGSVDAFSVPGRTISWKSLCRLRPSDFVRLARQFLTVEAEQLLRLGREIAVVVRRKLRCRERLRLSERRQAVCADATGGVKMNSPALRALIEIRTWPCETQGLRLQDELDSEHRSSSDS